MPTIYAHPWYSQLQKLENATTSESPLQPKLESEITGQKLTRTCKHCGNPASNNNDRHRQCDTCIALKKRYGINRVQRDWMHFCQAGVCANPACSNKATVIDHNHETGKVREMLCHSCNVALGHLEEDPQKMAGLIQYLGNHYENQINDGRQET